MPDCVELIVCVGKTRIIKSTVCIHFINFFGLTKEILLNLPRKRMVKVEQHNTVTSHSNTYVYIRCHYLVNLAYAVRNTLLELLRN